MDILDNKSPQIGSFFTALNELSDTIQKALQNCTPHLNGEKYLTNREVCQLLRISSRTLQNWRDTGKIQFIKLQGKILYRESDILKEFKK
ncbi:helix-turn-helix domain-containing protein [Bacteroides sp. BFG-606]|uniref:helix-turn-helix domain-containing protein n=1 Tax=Bacteroides sp. BFG-606 TaxID=2972763 RepID=UPI002165B125|nr:helix-turn-helix domain-containing protein [Bacteroides sp. BFG-606]MCS2336416.1 helix-turn-helix domain-containing protein [Bacteroides sp. BFG-606]